jgi:ATP/maltotriose-dependent transcriptional regulator MalT
MAAARVCWERALALNELESADELELRVEILIELADTHGKELRESSTASEQAVALAERIGKPDLLARALGVHGMKLTLLGRRPSDEYWQRALAVENAAGAPLRYAGPTSAYGLAAFLRGDHETSFGCSRRLAKSMRTSGDPMLPHVLFEMSELNRVVGDWDAAARYAQDAHELVLQTGREADEPDCLLWKARVALPRGDLDLAWRDAERALALAESLARSETQRAGVEATAKSVFAQIAWMSGRYAEAHDWNVAVIDAASQLGPFLEHFLGEALAGDVECLLSLGEIGEATAQLERLVELAEKADVDTLDAITERTRGVLAAAEGHGEAAVAHLERARDALEALAVPWPFQVARTLLALGGVQRRARQKQAARETLGQALEVFVRLGAALWAEKARSELSQIGGRPTRPGALTATEQRVADLVASGLSNAQVAHELFLSPKTVEWNLSKIYKKLHVRSRTELAAKLSKRAIAGPG